MNRSSFVYFNYWDGNIFLGLREQFLAHCKKNALYLIQVIHFGGRKEKTVPGEWPGGRKIMAKTVITLDGQQVTRLEQVLIDRDIEGAWELLSEIRAKIAPTRDTRCGIEKLRK